MNCRQCEEIQEFQPYGMCEDCHEYVGEEQDEYLEELCDIK